MAASMGVLSCQRAESHMAASLATLRFMSGSRYRSRLRSTTMSCRSLMVPAWLREISLISSVCVHGSPTGRPCGGPLSKGKSRQGQSTAESPFSTLALRVVML